MIFKVKNIGKISNADLYLDGITVLAGNNNTGKSTIGKSLFGLIQAFSNMQENIERQKLRLSRNIIFKNIQNAMDISSEGFYTNISIYVNRILHILNDCGENTKENIRTNLMKLGIDSEAVLDTIIEEYDKIQDFSDEIFIKKVASNIFQNIFYGKINSLLTEDNEAFVEAVIKEKYISVNFRDDNCIDYKKELNIMNRAIYIDDPFIIDELYVDRTGDYIRSVVKKQLIKKDDGIDNVLEQGIIEEQISETLKILDGIGIGDIYLDESGEYKYRDSTIDIPINNISTGIKSFAIIKTLLTNGSISNKDILILDEPEIHLHPEWQLKYAQLIVLLQKTLDLTILITTHSQVFLEAIELYSKKYNITNRCKYYFSNNTTDGFVDVTNNLEHIYLQMVNPSMNLDKLKWELEKESDE